MTDLVLPHGKNGIVKMGAPAPQGVKRSSIHRDDRAVRLVDMPHILRPFLTDKPQITAGDHGSFPVDHAHDPVSGLFDLQDNILKNSS